MFGLQTALCAGFSLYHVRAVVCAMCRLWSVLCAVVIVCCVQFIVTSLVASLRACLASLAWLASLAAGASRPQDPLRTPHAVTAAFGPLLLKLAHMPFFQYMYGLAHVYTRQRYTHVHMCKHVHIY